jgi:hypothetical protein
VLRRFAALELLLQWMLLTAATTSALCTTSTGNAKCASGDASLSLTYAPIQQKKATPQKTLVTLGAPSFSRVCMPIQGQCGGASSIPARCQSSLVHSRESEAPDRGFAFLCVFQTTIVPWRRATATLAMVAPCIDTAIVCWDGTTVP